MSGSTTPNRPEKSSARLSGEGVHGSAGGGGVTAAASNGLARVGNSASDAYYGAPDLGISSAANRAYQGAPDLGVGATISSVFGQGQASKPQRKLPTEFDDQEDDRVLKSGGGEKSHHDSSVQQTQQENGSENLTAWQESEKAGPSDKARVGKSQMQIGTETGIPTTAGAGSTLSPDKSNQQAYQKAISQGKVNSAHIPEDFVEVDCPTEHAGSEKMKSTDTTSSHGGGAMPSSGTKGHTRNKSSSTNKPRKSASSNHVTSTPPDLTSDGSSIKMEKRRSFGNRFKDQVKGEMKILAGTVTGKEDKIIQGLAIKHGEQV